MDSYRYVILGGGMAAGYAAKEFVELGAGPGELCIVSAESTAPYERPPLSKDFLAGKAQPDELLISDSAFYEEHGIALRLGETVNAVDFDARRVLTAGGDEIAYEKLLIATGSRVQQLHVPGAELDGIHYLRTRDDSQRIRARSATAHCAVVIGGGYIGVEVSAVLAQNGLATVVVLSGDTLLPRLFTPEMAAFFQRYYEERGVTFVRGSRAAAFKGSGRVESVVLNSGAELPADLVVAGVGVKPETDLFDGTDLHMHGGIVVNEYLETNMPHVWAAGDVANYQDELFGRRRHVEHWNNAVEGGKHAARAMMGRREPFRQVPYFFSDEFELSWEFWGDVEGADRVVHRGDVSSGQFSVWWLSEGRLVAAFVMDRPDDERELAPQWIEAWKHVRPEQLADAEQPLAAALI